jgi:hypothetical protein
MDNSTRRYPRVNQLHLISYVNREEGEQRTPVSMGRVLDLTPAGVGMEVLTEIHSGSIMEMEIDLRDSLLNVQGKVVHVHPADDGRFVVGVEFLEPQPALENLPAGT